MSHTILIADDSIFIREALCGLFEREEDFDVCGEAENGKEAVEKAQALHPDLILLDLTLPGMSGAEFIGAYHALPPPHAPIVLLTGQPIGSDEALEMGADGVLMNWIAPEMVAPPRESIRKISA